MAARRNHNDICEEAFASALQIDKVDYLKHIKVNIIYEINQYFNCLHSL